MNTGQLHTTDNIISEGNLHVKHSILITAAFVKSDDELFYEHHPRYHKLTVESF